MEIARVRATATLEGGLSYPQVFVLERSEASTYGNRTSVRRLYPDGSEELYDTRYDLTLSRDGSDFADWVERFLWSRPWMRPLAGVSVSR